MAETTVGGRAPAHEPGDIPAPGYEVIALLSRGRRLDVYDAWSHERETRCVLKMLRPERRGERRARELLLREGSLLERLSHPHIVRGYETISHPEPIVVMETLPGRTVGRLIEDSAPLAAGDVAHLGLHLASAMSYLHRHGFLHLDLKPDNVVADGTRAKVIDLSLARPPGTATAGIGTWSYLSPEQARGGDLTPAADVWGIGSILFEAASGAPAFPGPGSDSGDSDSSTHPSWETGGSENRWRGDYPQLESRAPGLAENGAQPPELGRLVDRCLAPDPTDRPCLRSLMAGLEPIARIPRAERRYAA